MCVSNEPCLTKAKSRTVLAQSSAFGLRKIGRMPDSPGKLKAFLDEHGEDSQKSAKPEASVRVGRQRQRSSAAHNTRNHSVRRNKYAT